MKKFWVLFLKKSFIGVTAAPKAALSEAKVSWLLSTMMRFTKYKRKGSEERTPWC